MWMELPSLTVFWEPWEFVASPLATAIASPGQAHLLAAAIEGLDRDEAHALEATESATLVAFRWLGFIRRVARLCGFRGGGPVRLAAEEPDAAPPPPGQ